MRRLQRVRRKFSLSLLLTAPAFLASCAGGIDGNGASPYLNANNQLKIVQTDPPQGAVDIALDKEIVLTFNQQLEPFMPGHERNFEIWSSSGSRFPMNPVVGGLLVPNPLGGVSLEGNATAYVSQVSIKIPSKYFMPQREYVVMWRDAPSKGSQEDARLAGIEAMYGDPPDRLAAGSIRFRTGSTFAFSQRPDVEVVNMSPGKEIYGANGATLSNSVDGYWVANPRPRITFMMSEAVRHYDADGYGTTIPAEITPRAICLEEVTTNCFSGVTLGAINSATVTNQVIAGLENAAGNASAWSDYWRNNFYQYPAMIHTEMGRRLIVVELAPGFNFHEKINDIAQIIAVGLTGWQSVALSGSTPARNLKNDYFVGGFVHYLNINAQMPGGFSSIYDLFPGGWQ